VTIEENLADQVHIENVSQALY